ncbi:dipeptide epimerase [Hanamia caeni]|uniref:Dipeptide epimerase n=1 Tax=Hanamia caeni TaxID=2294116 RepID=A0A3M9N4U5_9BACT|nr:dipeptide epimerase [Hanamia caeni]RNI32769.1 dipeptide epimerase [Hanamia caeni]
MYLEYKKSNLKFKHPFTISKGTKTHQPSLLVELELFGLKGYGEAPAISYYNVSVEEMISVIDQKKKMIEKFSFTEPERYWHYLHHLLPQHPFLVCALDLAAWDLYGKMKRKQLYQLWNLDISKNPLTDLTIGIDTIENMVAKIKETPWPVYKIKLGTDKDIEIMEALRKHTDSVFRIDANAAWKADEALEKIKIFAGLGVEFIEQPLAKDDWEGMKFLFENSPLPLIADESCVSEHDVIKCNGYFHGINIKLTKCSGITPALRMIPQARQLGMKVMVGSMNESSIGTAAIAQLLPLVDYVDMDGPLLLEEDVAKSVTFDYGKIIYGEGYGLGITVDAF